MAGVAVMEEEDAGCLEAHTRLQSLQGAQGGDLQTHRSQLVCSGNQRLRCVHVVHDQHDLRAETEEVEAEKAAAEAAGCVSHNQLPRGISLSSLFWNKHSLGSGLKSTLIPRSVPACVHSG